MTRRLFRPLLAALAVTLALTACGSSGAGGSRTAEVMDESASAPSAAADASAGSGTGTGTATGDPAPSTSNPYGAPPVDPPGPNEPILTVVNGKGAKTAFTLAALERLGTTTVTLYEPFVQRTETFTGVPLAEVLAAAKVPATASLTTIALNDYRYPSTAQALTDSSAILATRQGATTVPLDKGGPIRLVYPDGSALSGTLEAWNWSLARIQVTG